ncbi:hypothetical protein N9K05_03315 [Woeseiaceae bacterium]|nr:hypothetical protein [Woeseiaceae bacterium]
MKKKSEEQKAFGSAENLDQDLHDEQQSKLTKDDMDNQVDALVELFYKKLEKNKQKKKDQ